MPEVKLVDFVNNSMRMGVVRNGGGGVEATGPDPLGLQRRYYYYFII